MYQKLFESLDTGRLFVTIMQYNFRLYYKYLKAHGNDSNSSPFQFYDFYDLMPRDKLAELQIPLP